MSRLIQIDVEILELEQKREALVKERERLVASSISEETVLASSPMQPSEKIRLFLSLFRCRGDVFPRLWENPKSGRKGYSPVCRNEWVRGICEKPRVKCSECVHQAFLSFDESIARDHLTGRQTIGTYAIREDDSCTFIAADFDGEGWREDIQAYCAAAKELGVNPAIERSRSGDGGHAWIFFDELVPAFMARRLGTLIVAKASSFHPAMKLSSYDRFFPNQDKLPAGGFGNLIALPLQAKPRELGNSIFVNDSFIPHRDQWSYLSELPRISKEQLNDLVDFTLPPVITEGETEQDTFVRYEDRALDVIPNTITRGVFTGTAKAIRHAQVEISTSGLPVCLIAALKRLATLANPVFFEKQRLRFGTYNIPRFIFCGEIHPNRLMLPRGVTQAALDLCRKAGGRLLVEDCRPAKMIVSFKFQGELSPSQQSAVNAMLKHEDGVLIAPPGAGKTVMGCAIIAARNVSTLVLVHRKPLLEQWRLRLSDFLGLDHKEIGILGQKVDSASYGVVVGMVQTLAKAPNPASLLEPFTQIIVDECHHIPAASFEAVMKVCPCRFFLGLTATPIRKDGLQKILFLQCGPIRHRMDSKDESGIVRKLIVRDIHLGFPPDEARMPIHQVWDLLVNHTGRNEQIAADVAAALAEGRNSAVLSDRREHLELLESLLQAVNPSLAERIHRIDGAMGMKQRAAIMEKIAAHCVDGKGFVLFATSSLLGEGFDLPQLNTLFLTLPLSFKGRLVQYAGRLHRECAGKAEVRIYDYVEPEHPLTAHMHRKRLAAYRSMGYQAGSDV